MRKSVKRAIVIGTAVAVTGAVGTAAFASWLANGSGDAYAKAGQAQELQITEATTTATLYPGVVGDASIKIKNPNPYPVKVSTIAWTPGDGVKASGGIGTCVNTGVYFGDFSKGPVGSNGVLSGLKLELEAGEARTFTLTDAVRMIDNSENGCQNATFRIPVKVTGASAAK